MTKTDVTPMALTGDLLDKWATDLKGPVALRLKQQLVPVEFDKDEMIVYPPTFADVGYNIDRLSDGTQVALIDSVGSQANRLEPAFKSDSGHGLGDLVPQIEIVLRIEGCGECTECKKDKPNVAKCKKPWKVKRSLFDLAHRAADAVVQSSPSLLPDIARAFETLRKTGNAGPLCAIAPTSLIFGCWDSRGGSGEKLPRLVRSLIRGWDVDVLHASAQFNSISKLLSEDDRAALEKEAKAKKKKLSATGFADAPATFRKVSTAAAAQMTEFRNGSPNLERRILGGVVVHDRIQRDITVNLVALRGICGKDKKDSDAIRKYLLALSLLAATIDIDLFLREGCNLRYADKQDQWFAVPRRGDAGAVDLVSEEAQALLRTYAETQSKQFTEARAKLKLEHEFDLSEAKKLLSKKSDDESGGGES